MMEENSSNSRCNSNNDQLNHVTITTAEYTALIRALAENDIIRNLVAESGYIETKMLRRVLGQTEKGEADE